MNAFVQRIANYLANEIIVKQLAQNKSFQNMAMRTHLRVEKTKEFMKEGVERAEMEGLEGLKKSVGGVAGEAGAKPPKGGIPEPPKTGVTGFMR